MKGIGLVLGLCVVGCQKAIPDRLVDSRAKTKIDHSLHFKNPGRVIHVVVALCDNKYQGIVPVPAHLGNGEDLKQNLYWGSQYGVKAYLQVQKDWKLVPLEGKPDDGILERVAFKHRSKPVWLIADAYQGRRIHDATRTMFHYAAGEDASIVTVDKVKIAIGGGADLVAYVGHDGLMDFSLKETFPASDKRHRDVVILACKSKQFFGPHLKSTGARPLLWTTNLMAPEAYVLLAAIDGWLAEEDGEQIRLRAATAYNKFQKCGLRGAKYTFATGW